MLRKHFICHKLRHSVLSKWLKLSGWALSSRAPVCLSIQFTSHTPDLSVVGNGCSISKHKQHDLKKSAHLLISSFMPNGSEKWDFCADRHFYLFDQFQLLLSKCVLLYSSRAEDYILLYEKLLFMEGRV